jgi:flagellin-like hook-associated protein FlgL
VALTLTAKSLTGQPSNESSSSLSPLSKANNSGAFAGTQRINSSESTVNGNAEDSVELSILAQTQAASRGSADASRELSNASSYVSVAQSAANEIDRLLEQAEEKSKEFENSVTGENEAVQAEIGQILRAIDNISDASTVNGQSIVNNGEVTFSTDFNAGDNSSDTAFSISVGNLALDRASLGVSSTEIRNMSAEELTETIQSAKSSVGDVIVALDDAEAQIDAVADRIGSRASAEVKLTQEDAAAAENITAEGLAEKISDDILSTPLAAEVHSLSAAKVQDLLVDRPDDSNSDDDREPSNDDDESRIRRSSRESEAEEPEAAEPDSSSRTSIREAISEARENEED